MGTEKRRVGNMLEQPLYYKMIAEAVISNADSILDAIDRYLAKAEKNLADTLADEGFAEAEKTVEAINSLHEDVAEALQNQTEEFVAALKEAPEDDWEKAQENVAEMLENDEIAEHIEEAAMDMFQTEVPKLATIYIRESDGDLVVDTIRQRTESWIASWSQRLGELMKVSTHKQMTDAIQNTIDKGESIQELTRKIMDGGWRSEYYKARRVAVTEVLRAHSVAREEAIQQSPSTDRKEWRHTGTHKNKPRPNHVEMDGKIVPKDEPFELKGRDGNIYHPRYPRDPEKLPASETINCHCIHRGVAADDAIGMSLEERRRLQQKYIEEDDAAWKKELDEQNKAKAGITPYSTLESFKGKTREEQVKYLGKTKMALYDAGLIDSDEMLSKVKKSSLQKLREDGIFTVGSDALNHSVKGTYKAAMKQYPKGRMVSGGHAQAAMEECASKGIEYGVVGTFSNGVRIGNVPSSEMKKKKIGNGQAWFPEDWDKEKILVAGTSVANNGAELEEGYHKTGVYDNVAVRVLFKDGNIETICPDLDQNLYVEGVEWNAE